MMNKPPLTNTGRPLDPGYPTNLAILAFSGIVFIAGLVWRMSQGAALPAAGWWALVLGGTTFFGWALSREIDPDSEWVAFAAAALAGLAVLWLGLPDILLMAWMLLAVRILVRTTGLPAAPVDTLTVLVLALFVVYRGGWIAGLATAVIFALDGRLPAPHRPHGAAAVAALLLTVLMGVWRSAAGAAGEPSLPFLVAGLLLLLLFSSVVVASGRIRSVGDYTGKTLSPARFRAAQVVTGLIALGYVLWSGAAGFIALAPVWAAMLGLGLSRLVLAGLGRRSL